VKPVQRVAVSVGVVFVGLAVVMALRLGERPDLVSTALLGRPVPDLTLPTIEGGEVSLAGLGGRVVIVNFFNSWCVPCKEEEPSLRAFHARHAAEPGFVMVGIVRDDTDRAVRRWAEGRDVGWTIAFDPDGRAAVDFGTTGQPETYAVSPTGVVVAKHLGRATRSDLEDLLALARGEQRGDAR
jgi:cytochrome c biogenesis protein CcmG/thiol:disulfide interchange protein DsbE